LRVVCWMINLSFHNPILRGTNDDSRRVHGFLSR
jgi:hypothetical protein